MAQFEYGKQLSKLMTPEITAALGEIREYRGKQAVYESVHPNALKALVDVAKIQSTEASNRIENISTSSKRLRELMEEKTAPINRDEREITGYRYVLDIIHESHRAIPVTPNVILQLHRDLYRYSGEAFAGAWKDSDNVIAERSSEGKLVVRFKPTSAAATPAAMQKICDEYNAQIEQRIYDPALASLVFVFDFVSIHPFNDGNGRMSRLLTLLLLYKSGYAVGKYISVEKEIERTKKTYYEALHASSFGWQTGENDYSPFITYMLGVLIACGKELDRRLAIAAKSTSAEEAIRAYFSTLIGCASKREIMDANPSISQRTMERTLKKLQDKGVIEKVGAARSTKYKLR